MGITCFFQQKSLPRCLLSQNSYCYITLRQKAGLVAGIERPATSRPRLDNPMCIGQTSANSHTQSLPTALHPVHTVPWFSNTWTPCPWSGSIQQLSAELPSIFIALFSIFELLLFAIPCGNIFSNFTELCVKDLLCLFRTCQLTISCYFPSFCVRGNEECPSISLNPMHAWGVCIIGKTAALGILGKLAIFEVSFCDWDSSGISNELSKLSLYTACFFPKLTSLLPTLGKSKMHSWDLNPLHYPAWTQGQHLP